MGRIGRAECRRHRRVSGAWNTGNCAGDAARLDCHEREVEREVERAIAGPFPDSSVLTEERHPVGRNTSPTIGTDSCLTIRPCEPAGPPCRPARAAPMDEAATATPMDEAESLPVQLAEPETRLSSSATTPRNAKNAIVSQEQMREDKAAATRLEELMTEFAEKASQQSIPTLQWLRTLGHMHTVTCLHVYGFTVLRFNSTLCPNHSTSGLG